MYNQLTSINLPLAITIWVGAFQNNQLTSINLPKVETIEFDAFQNNNFIEVTLPASLKELWEWAFKWNWVLTVRNNSNLTEEQIKQAFDYEKVREYYDKNWVVHCRKNWNPCK